MKEGRQGFNCRRASRWALIDLGETAYDCVRVGTTTGEAAARALRLRQQGVYVLGGLHHAC
jgi:hypothetical protein